MTTHHLTLIGAGPGERAPRGEVLLPAWDQAPHETKVSGAPGWGKKVVGPASCTVSAADLAETSARHADELAALAEDAGRLVVAQRAALAEGDVVEAARLGWGLGGALRALSGSLGELHGDLDVLAHYVGPGAS